MNLTGIYNIIIIMTLCLLLFIYSCTSSANENIITQEEKISFKDSLNHELNIIHFSDQQYRTSTDIDDLRTQNTNDYFNQIKVDSILKKFGWPDMNVIGKKGSEVLFLVIQHSNTKKQREMLPLVRQAVIDHKLSAKYWILLEDRISIANTGKQIYGSQVQKNISTGKFEVSPIQDEKNVNIRRQQLGLESLEDYLLFWNIKYSVPEK